MADENASSLKSSPDDSELQGWACPEMTFPKLRTWLDLRGNPNKNKKYPVSYSFRRPTAEPEQGRCPARMHGKVNMLPRLLDVVWE
ncbi:hypothetical protein IMZ48_17420 [Candidatus Bathyarchaeota archaeon]|nr:hypothetical protein [Candidatus Bathyarchaeota archaeon]